METTLPSTRAVRERRRYVGVVEAEDLQTKPSCLNAVLDQDPENEPATLALLLFDQRQPTNQPTALGPLLTHLVYVACPDRPCCRSVQADGV